MRGRKPRSPLVEKALGSPGHRKSKSVRAVRRLRPDIPKWAGAEAQRYLATVLPELERVGVLSIVDGAGLGALGECYADLVFWRHELAKERRKKRPEREEVRKLQREVRSSDDAFRKWATEYGLTEVSRTRMGAGAGGDSSRPPDPNTDDLDD